VDNYEDGAVVNNDGSWLVGGPTLPIVPAGSYEGTIAIEETSALGPGTTTKWYAPGVGVVMEKAKREQLNLISSSLVSP